MSAGLYVLPLSLLSFYCFFDTQILISQRAERVPVKQYVTGLVLDRNPKIHSDVSPMPPNFYRVKKCKNLASIFDTCSL